MSKDKMELKESIGGQENILPVFKVMPRENLNVVHGPAIVYKRNIAGQSMIWNHTVYGIFGTAEWSDKLYAEFVLGDSTYGVLGLSPLGKEEAAFVVYRVINPDNEWRELIRSDLFKDSNTTATWDTSNHRWTFTSGQILQTKSIFKNDTETITKATLKILSSNITNSSNLTFYLSADGGSSWEEVTNNEEHSFTNTGTDLRLKIVASGNAQIDIEDSEGTSTLIKVSYVTA